MSVNGIRQNYYPNNTAITNRYYKNNAVQFHQREQAIEESVSERTTQSTSAWQNTSAWNVFEAQKSRVSNEYAEVQDGPEGISEAGSITDKQLNTLMSETVQARFPLQEVDEEGNRKEKIYLIAVDQNGIRCSKPGQDGYEWEILFTDESQYESAREFLSYAEEFMDNFLFAAHDNFWKDYLDGNMDVDAFKEFLEGTNNGIPDYSLTVGDSMYIDVEKIKWAPYMNPLGVKFYTAEEMKQMQAELIKKNTAGLGTLSEQYSIMYKKLHPEYNGERIFCEYPGGPLYTAGEIIEVMNRNLKDAKYQAEAKSSITNHT